MELIRKGAEAELYKSEYMGRAALVKERIPKNYRNRQLDEKIRRLRTKEECLLLQKAKNAGIPVPSIYKIDRGACSITMEFVGEQRAKDFLDGGNYKKTCSEIGKYIGIMHSSGLIHGDLTTSNIIVSNNRLVFIDFGLGFNSEKKEDKAVDLLAFKKTFMATHFRLAAGWELIVKGYLEECPKGNAIIRQIGKVEARVRYH